MGKTLILGGSTLATALASEMAAAGMPAVLSYAGRTESPLAQPVPTRTGGFGGVDGLVTFLNENSITAIVDATHPFAAQMSAHAIEAASIADANLLALEPAPWTPAPGDKWICVADIDAAVTALDTGAQRIFLAIGRLNLASFASRSQHHYLLRLVDRPKNPLPLPNTTVIIERGPFTLENDIALMQTHGIDLIVAKNAGGNGARAKIDAARSLKLPVIMVERPVIAERPVVSTVSETMHWLVHEADLGV
ncbi:MAG: cobalt-precorrin-6A reductase [Anderseniella sp.]